MPVTIDPPLVGMAVAAPLYFVGTRRMTAGAPPWRRARATRRALAFYGGLLALVAALASPIDSLAQDLLWVHMIQHLLLMVVAAPLIVMGAPWLPVWRPLPLSFRRRAARQVARSRWWLPVRRGASFLARPVPAWIAFNANLAFWHFPGPYDLTLRSAAAHDLEHLSFLVLGMLLWAQVLDSPPLRRRLAPLTGVLYITLAAAASWLLAVVLALYPSPLYAEYAHLAHRPGGLSALADQQIAAGVMWGPGSVPFTIVDFLGLDRWLGKDEDERKKEALAAKPSPNGRGTPERIAADQIVES